MEADWLERLQQLVGTRLGREFRPSELEELHRIAASRQKELRCTTAQYWQRLRCERDLSGAEWQQIIARLTNGESFFFRDALQMELLRRELLPEAVRQRGAQRVLRVWSAGCATGEEPYSLAVLLAEVVGSQSGWRLQVLGTDIDEDRLRRAGRAVYSAWSLRALAECRREAYFRPQGDGWELRPEFRAVVRFLPLNLATDDLHAAGPGYGDFDLILCRNVFMYLAKGAVATAAAGLRDALRPGGWLITGHTEMPVPLPAGLIPRSYPGSVVYQRVALAAQTEHPAKVAAPLAAGAFDEAPPAGGGPSVDPAAQLVQAALQAADQGHLDGAEHLAREALALVSTAASPHRILATVAEERGDLAQARERWRRVLYLAPEDITAQLRLAALYRAAGEHDRADRLRRAVRRLLAALDPAEPVPDALGQTAGQLLEQVGSP